MSKVVNMIVQKWWSWLMSKRFPDTAKNRRYVSMIYAGVAWNICILTYLYHFVDIGMGSTEAQKTALLKYHKNDTVHSITINGLSKIEKKVIPSIEDEQQDEHSEIDS